jgi:hypothetical protein
MLLAAASASVLAQPAERIQLRQLEAMFAQMRAKTPWNVDGPLLWGYFFFGANAEKIKTAAAELQTQGYRVVEVAEVPGRGLWRLHVERVEHHTPQTLDVRNSEFYAFATRHGLESYDGMDVGAPTK